MKPQSSSRDAHIAKRIRSFRETLNLTQEEFAQALEIKRERLASYEDNRNALPWEVYLLMADRFLLNPFWLAEGEEYPRAPFPGDIRAVNVPPRMPFSTAFEKYRDDIEVEEGELPPLIPDDLREAADVLLVRLDQLAEMEPEQRLEVLHMDWLAPRFADLIQALSLWLAEANLELAGASAKAHLLDLWKRRREQAIMEAAQKKSEEGQDSHLPNIAESATIPPMASPSPSLKSLLEDVRKLTSSRGMKAKLARYLGVDKSRITDWLNNEKTRGPDANRTLLLQQFVNEPSLLDAESSSSRRKQKAPRQ